MACRIQSIAAALFLFSMGWLLSTSFAAQEPVGLLIQARGQVHYSTGNDQWKPVKRNKFLYDGWRVKTGPGSQCKLLYQDANEMEALGADTEVIVRASGSEILRGTAARMEPAASLVGFMERKFAKVQKYAAVQRKAGLSGQVSLRTAGRIVLCPQYPDLVWENLGPEYSYRLQIGSKSYEVPAGDGKVVRQTVPPQDPGEHVYQVLILYMGEVLYAPSRKGVLVWLDQDQEKELKAKIAGIDEVDPGNGFLLGNLFDEEGLKVAAMDEYQTYLKENPDADEARPFLLKVLHELGLAGEVDKQAHLYRESRCWGER